MWCETYRWKGHKYDTPIETTIDDEIVTVNSCKCGLTRQEVDIQKLKKSVLNYNPVNTKFVVSIVLSIITVLITSLVVPTLISEINNLSTQSGNISTEADYSSTWFPSLIIMLAFGLGLVLFISKFLRFNDY
jgi:type II secretory pathway component PulF